MAQNTPPANEWISSAEQKLWGLMQIWSEAKYNFAFFDRLPDLDWDTEVQKRIPQVLAAQDVITYYHILQELVALLNDGHTIVMLPGEIRAGLDAPPLELAMVEGKIVLVRVGDSPEVREQGVHPGQELLAIDGRPAGDVMREDVLRYYRGGTPQWGEAFGLYSLLQGLRDEMVALTLKDIDGKTNAVRLKRNSNLGNGRTFTQRVLDHDPLLEMRMLGSIAYFRLSTFGARQIVDEFNREFDCLDLEALTGMILDIRYNIGGETGIGFGILARLIDRPLAASKWRTRKSLAGYRAWGEPEEWFEDQMPPVQPCEGKRYTGPLAVLVGPHTFSSAEDFLVPLAYAKRATLVGEKTGGSTGQPLWMALPGGGFCRICTLQSFFPDGREFVGRGIEPDILVCPTQKDIFENRDPVLKEAIHCLSSAR